MNDTNIRWTDKTWNPVHGCSKTSEGCRNCYAERVSYEKFGNTESEWTPENADENVSVKWDRLGSEPGEASWVFVNSMSDLLHPNVSDRFIEAVLSRCEELDHCCFLVLTKHGPDTERDIPCEVPDNVMVGVSVETQGRTYRADWLREQDVGTRFVSFEPLLEDIAPFDLSRINWVIIGGESEPDPEERREMHPRWARRLVRNAKIDGTAVFFKQDSGPRPEDNITLDLGDGEGPQRIEEFPVLPESVPPAPQEFLRGDGSGDA